MADPDSDTDRLSRRRRPILAVIALLAVVAAVVAAIIWRSTPDVQAPPPGPTQSTTPSALATPPSPPLEIVSVGDRLDAAVATAFPRGASAPGADGERYLFKTHKLVEASFGPVLISEGQAQDAAHVVSGRLDIAYLRPTETGFAVVKRYPAAVTIGSFGQMSRWDVSDRFGAVPTIEAEGGFTGQGYTCGATLLTELRPDGPVEVANLRSIYDDSGAAVDRPAQSIEGKIAKIEKGRGFDLSFTGTKSFTEHYSLKGGKYVRDGATALPEC